MNCPQKPKEALLNIQAKCFQKKKKNEPRASVIKNNFLSNKMQPFAGLPRSTLDRNMHMLHKSCSLNVTSCLTALPRA